MNHPSPFSRFAQWVARASGTPAIFVIAVAIIVGWGASGPLFHFSDTWQLVINTGTTIVTFLMVFLIQNTQNRDTAAVQAKLDELIRATKLANNAMLDLEDVDDKTLERLREHYRKLAEQAPGDINKMLDEYERKLEQKIGDKHKAVEERG
ncbi:MAG TPA: low affinity iron permease family protein [Rhodanobacteraceae bacterium]|nr:low affinity iron permease family protein [Rhodanobacteraceae bacterium]